MAGTVTTTGSDYHGEIKKFVMNWVSDASGAADLITTEKFTGRLICAQHVPGTDGAAPTTAYDVVVRDDQGTDILAATGTNITVPGNKSSQAVSSGLPFPSVANTTLTLAVTNAGNAKSGKVILYFADAYIKPATI